MEKIIIGSDLTTKESIGVELPSIIIATGDKLSGKTFMIRTLIDRKGSGRIVLLTNKPDSYHGLGETIVTINKDNHKMEIKDRLTIIDASELYDDDPDHVLDTELANLRETLEEGDLLVVDEIYPFLMDELNKYELMKTAEMLKLKKAGIILTTNQPLFLMERGPVLFKISDYAFTLRQSKQTAVKVSEAFGGEPARYELLRFYDVFDFGRALFMSREGDLNYIQIG